MLGFTTPSVFYEMKQDSIIMQALPEFNSLTPGPQCHALLPAGLFSSQRNQSFYYKIHSITVKRGTGNHGDCLLPEFGSEVSAYASMSLLAFSFPFTLCNKHCTAELIKTIFSNILGKSLQILKNLHSSSSFCVNYCLSTLWCTS